MLIKKNMVNSIYKDTKNFIDRKVSTKQAINILAKNDIAIDEEEAAIILEFFYLIAKLYGNPSGVETDAYPKAKIEPPNMR